jgi:eukaryotic-like serine/threonine-protein kinase
LPELEISRIITEHDPPKPSTVAPRELAREIEGDLDTIIAKAMHKSVDSRYGAAQILAYDITRYLEGHPVQARGDTVTYRALKFFQRNRVSVLAATLAAFGLFAGGLAAAWQRGVAISKEKEARKRFGRYPGTGELVPWENWMTNSSAFLVLLQRVRLLARRILIYLDRLSKEEVNDVSLQRDLAAAYERLGDVEGGSTVANLGGAGCVWEGDIHLRNPCPAKTERSAVHRGSNALLLQSR